MSSSFPSSAEQALTTWILQRVKISSVRNSTIHVNQLSPSQVTGLVRMNAQHTSNTPNSQQVHVAHSYSGAQSLAQAALSNNAPQSSNLTTNPNNTASHALPIPTPLPLPQQPQQLNPRKRRAGAADGVPSSRGVANLTPEQLTKKRANDREAQRAIRERTRNQIDSLERRIRELESQQPFQELQNVVRARDALVRENEELRRRLAGIMAIVQPAMPQAALNGMSLVLVM